MAQSFEATRKKYQIKLDKKKTQYHIDKDIYSFLSVLKMVPTHRSSFDSSVDALIKFSDVSIFKFPVFLTKYVYNEMTKEKLVIRTMLLIRIL